MLSRILARGIAISAILLVAISASAQTIVVTTTADTPDANIGDGICADANGDCSLRAAIQETNANGGLMTVPIQLQQNTTYTLTIAGAGEDAGATGDLDIASNINIQGNNSTLDVDGLDRAFDVLAGGSLTVTRLTILNGAVTGSSGGAFRSVSSLIVSRVTISDSVATGAGASGGGIFNDGGTLVVSRCVFDDNDATRAGGAIETNAGFCDISLTDFTDNETGPMPGNGGAIHMTGQGTVNVERCDFTGNIAFNEGGALWNFATGIMNVGLCVINNNVANGPLADDGGGGLFNNGGLMQVFLCEVSGNTAPMGLGSGGGILNNGGALIVVASEISDNQSNRAGGGIEANIGMTSVFSSLVSDNMTGAAPGNGGGLHLTGPGIVTVGNCFVTDNTASAEGGGMWNSAVGTMVISGSIFDGNFASGNASDQGGGGLFNDGGILSVGGNIFRDNVADGASGSGGGILNNGGTLTVTGSLFSDNLSNRAGGGIEANVGINAVASCVFAGNITGASPGNGGAFHTSGAGTANIAGCFVLFNDAANEGGGLWNSSTGTMTVTNTTIFGNDAPIGADVFNQGGTFTIDGVPVL